MAIGRTGIFPAV